MNTRQTQFVAEYLVDLNASQAARRVGYSPKTSYSIGQELLKKPDIAQAIEAAKAERLARTQTNADEILTHLTSGIRAKISDIRNDDGTFRPISEWPDIWQQLSNGGDVDIEELSERSHDYIQAGDSKAWDKVGTVTKVKHRFADRARLIELAMRHTQVNALALPKEEHQHVHIHIEVESRLQRARELAAQIADADTIEARPS